MSQDSSKIGFISLGCPKALVDSERILSQLRAEGYQLSNSYQDADLVIINTCGFIEDAVQESFDTIGEALFENGRVIVTGCLGGREEGKMVLEAYPEVLAVSGAHAYEDVLSHVHKHLPPKHEPFLDLLPPQGIKLTPRHYAYLKISEGCHHQCSFCIIPQLRGTLDSRPIGQVLDEAARLVDSGVKELLVVSQDTSAYGLDIKYKLDMWGGKPMKTKFYDLVKGMSELDVWTRLHYVYPYPHVDEIIELMSHERVLPYLDIPFQHAHPDVLKNMRRPAAAERNLERINKWRSINPDISIRSTFIVGFPGETEAQFETLLDFIEEAKLDRIGCFKYSPVDGAPAHEMFDMIPEEIQEDRFERFMELQAKISAEKLAEKVGRKYQVLIDEASEERVMGRTYSDAPDIDGAIYLPLDTKVAVGEFVQVTVVDSDDYDLYGEIVS